MSATAQPPQESPERYECDRDDCEQTFEEDQAIHGSYCSAGCYYRSKGAKALDRIASDHRWCATCFRQIKEVERPSDAELVDMGVEWSKRECFVGFQYATPNATEAVDALDDEATCPIEVTRLGCTCGNADPSNRHEILRELDLKHTIVALYDCLVALEAHGTLNDRPDRGEYFSALREHWRDWEYAVGRALHA